MMAAGSLAGISGANPGRTVVSDITQTHATLSVEVPDGMTFKRFEYHPGSFPELSDFAAQLLSPESDIVTFTMNDYQWKQRNGWVESYYNTASPLPNGQKSVLTTTVTLNTSTTVSFEWSVDSEEGYGLMAFTVDGEDVSTITGDVPFTAASFPLTSGRHVLAWEYRKTSSGTNLGSDMAKLRNLTICETKPNPWYTEWRWWDCNSSASVFTIDELRPGREYLCRAVWKDSGGTEINGPVAAFETKDVSLGDLLASPITQTTAKLSAKSDFGDARPTAAIYKTDAVYGEHSEIMSALLSPDTYGSKIDITNVDGVDVSLSYNDGVNLFGDRYSKDEISITVDMSRAGDMKFEYETNNQCAYLTINGKRYTLSSTDHKRKSDSISLSMGKNVITFEPAYTYYSYGLLNLRNLDIPSLASLDVSGKEKLADLPDANIDYQMKDLDVAGDYDVCVEVSIPYKSMAIIHSTAPGSINKWVWTTFEYVQKRFCHFKTKDVSAEVVSVSDLKQASAVINGKFVVGDAPIEEMGIEYKDDASTRWTDYPAKDLTSESFKVALSRLKPSTSFKARAYIKVKGAAERKYSTDKAFTTLSVVPGEPKVENVTGFSAKVTGTTGAGDARLYASGVQYHSEFSDKWIDIEGVVDGENYSVDLTGLHPNTSYSFRSYVQPTGCDVIYSKTATFKTGEPLIVKVVPNCTSATFTAALNGDPGDDVEIGYFVGKTDVGPYTIYDGEVKIQDLLPGGSKTISFRVLVGKSNPYENYQWVDIRTKDFLVEVIKEKLTQTTAEVSFKFDPYDAEGAKLQYRDMEGEWHDYGGGKVKFTGLVPGGSYHVNLRVLYKEQYYNFSPESGYFNTLPVNVYGVSVSDIACTSAAAGFKYSVGDATLVSSGIMVSQPQAKIEKTGNGEYLITELEIGKEVTVTPYVETKEGGRVTGTARTFKTLTPSFTTGEADQISNRSARLNGTIGCDDRSSAEFGFQWKSMTGWQSDPAFTKGRKGDDGSISVALVNGMLEPNTDYQFRAAVRYHGVIYSVQGWQSFRTESEYVVYPGMVYTLFRTDRENNAIVFCGYYVAGSEEVKEQGYEYWPNVSRSGGVIRVKTDESMLYELPVPLLSDGAYSVRAYIVTESGVTYGQTLTFSVSGGQVGIDDIILASPQCRATESGVELTGCAGLSARVFDLQGREAARRDIVEPRETIELPAKGVYIVVLSNGDTWKVLVG